MTQDEYKKIETLFKDHRASWTGGLVSLGLRMGTTILGISLSLSNGTLYWLLGQIILGFSFFHWFSILHDCGHNSFFPKKWANELVGFLSSVCCLVPYSSWKYVHLEHHQWTGWLDKDPSTRDLLKATPAKKLLARWVWRSYLPLFAMAFLLGTFWNFFKLATIFKKKKIRLEILLNFALILAVHVCWELLVGHWWQVFGFSFVLFGIICEPIILSQHVHIPMGKSHPHPQVYPIHEQDHFTRSLQFPLWISRYLTLSFENHIAHHFFPWVPSYLLYQVQVKTGNEASAFTWIREARKIPGDVLMFQDRNETGLKI